MQPGKLMKAAGAAFFLVLLTQGALAAVTVEDIVAKARGRYEDAYRQLKDLTVVQLTKTVSQPVPPDPSGNEVMTRIYTKGDRFRIESSVREEPGEGGTSREKAMTGVMVFDGRDLWMMTPMFGKTRVPRREARLSESYADWWNHVSKGARLEGTEMASGRACYVIANSPDSGAVFSRLWIDKMTYHLLRGRLADASLQEATVMVFSRFKKVRDSVELPHLIRVFRNGSLATVTSVLQAKANTGLPDTLFDPGTMRGGTARRSEKDGSGAFGSTTAERR